MMYRIANLLRRHGMRATEAALARLPQPRLERRAALLEQLVGVAPEAARFDLNAFLHRVEAFVDSQRVDRFDFRFSNSCRRPTLYGSAYACLVYAQSGRLSKLGSAERTAWISHFDTFQSEADGLFRDPLLAGDSFERGDWWGARHLLLHMLPAYRALGGRPRYPLRFLDAWKDPDVIALRLAADDWCGRFTHENDVDNFLMNLAGAMQHARDEWDDDSAATALAALQRELLARLNPATGMWGDAPRGDPAWRSRMVQFAYHLYPILFFDGLGITSGATLEAALAETLATQNAYGGFGLGDASSACEDIDSIEILVRLGRGRPAVDRALLRALAWVLVNQNSDGGLVFRRGQPLSYGHAELSAAAGESELFSTWFRMLTVVRIVFGLGGADHRQPLRAPGYYF